MTSVSGNLWSVFSERVSFQIEQKEKAVYWVHKIYNKEESIALGY